MNTTTAKNRRIRIALLRLLKTEYPGTLDVKALHFSLDNLGYPMPEGELMAHLGYLKEKGYVNNQHRTGLGVKLTFASLTAEGWDLIDELLSERGVDKRL